MKQTLLTCLFILTLYDAQLFSAQTKPSNTPNDDSSLTMTAIGNGHMFGHRAAFRTYETQDHTEALVWYTTFRTEQEAKNAIKQSLREHKVSGTEVIKDINGGVIGDRIIARSEGTKEAFMVIQRQGLNCWIIRSISLEVAKQVAGLIEAPPNRNQQGEKSR